MARITEGDWRNISRQGVGGRLLPVISDRFFWELDVGYDVMVRAWADEMGYPGGRAGRSQLAQYLAVDARDPITAKEEYLWFVRQVLLRRAEARDFIDQEMLDELEERRGEMSVSEMAREIGVEALIGEGFDAYRTLARLDLPIYITTGYHEFLEQALREAGKEPRSLICGWRDDLPDYGASASGSGTNYSREEPLVFHLFGLDSVPESLVLSEEDHLHFLTRLALDPDIIPLVVRQAMTLSSLLLLGYNIREWEFRVVRRGLIPGQSRRLRRIGVASQPDPERLDQPNPERLREFVERYLEEGSFRLYWGSNKDFCRELSERVGG